MPESPTLPVIIFSSYTNIKPYLNMSSGIYVLQMNWIKPLCIERFNFNHGSNTNRSNYRKFLTCILTLFIVIID